MVGSHVTSDVRIICGRVLHYLSVYGLRFTYGNPETMYNGMAKPSWVMIRFKTPFTFIGLSLISQLKLPSFLDEWMVFPWPIYAYW